MIVTSMTPEEVYREIDYHEIFAKNEPSSAVLERFEKHFGFALLLLISDFLPRGNIQETMNIEILLY